ncbi:DUF6282 family protein [Clostridium sediminicola]|uniref:DUF6282 family protein n=1 Tax=Clostridium sediminicola TaxID=3114879 RepID=UPI0031F20955
MKTKHHDQALSLIRGAYDLHIHTNPSPFRRSVDDFELVLEAAKFGMAGVLIKSHYELTSSRAALVNMKSGVLTKAYGGIALNWPVGGLNPYAVENALKTGAVIVWMPTRDAKNSLCYGNMPGDFFNRSGISIYNDVGEFDSRIYEIFEIVKKYGAYLATGHLEAKESVDLCKAGRDYGVQMILTHPEFDRTMVPGTVQSELAKLGVLIEKNWYNIAEGSITAEAMAENIRTVGPEYVYLATDRGQYGQEHPALAMVRFIETMLDQGFNDKDITTMIRTVPERIVVRD